jgi:predicted dehydrogenase
MTAGIPIKRIAIIGTRGHWGTVARELENMPSLEVVALCEGGDTVAPLTKWCAENQRTPIVVADHRTMLDQVRPDMVVVCGPFEQHAQMCIDAIDRGVHVLTEKPAALNFEDLDRLRQACQRQPDVHLAGMMFSRYTPGFYTAWRLIRSDKAIGEVRLIDARKSYRLGERPAYYRDRATYGGTIPWIGSHAIDWVMWFADAKFETVAATHSTAHNAGNGTMERSAACQFTLTGGAIASVSIDVFRPPTAPSHGDDWARIVGTDGVLEVRPQSVMLINSANNGSSPVPVACDRTPLRDFIDHIEGKARSLIDAQSTLDLTDACLRARQAADEKRIVAFKAPARA